MLFRYLIISPNIEEWNLIQELLFKNTSCLGKLKETYKFEKMCVHQEFSIITAPVE